MNRYFTAFQYLEHRLKSKGWDSFHSPYLFKLFSHCCDENNFPAVFDEIEKQRKILLQSQEVIHRVDFGTGAAWSKAGGHQKISTIARNSLSLPFQCRFLSRLAQFMKAKSIVEFGTSLGISAAYLAASGSHGQVTTVEGDPEVAKRAAMVIDALGLKNINILNKSFEEFINPGLEKSPLIELLFLDGNHRKESLLHYYLSLRLRMHPDAVIVVDDIYWSADMLQGWKQLQQMPEITQSVDCFHFGLLFFRADFLYKENHSIRFPWRALF